MTQFDEREQAFERQFELEEEKNFRIVARATKAIADWAGDKMQLDDAGKKAYTSAVLLADLEGPHHVGLLGKISEDFVSKGIRVSLRDIGQQYEAFLVRARKDVQAEEGA